LDAAAAKGFGNALYEYDEEEVFQVQEEFYSMIDKQSNTGSTGQSEANSGGIRSLLQWPESVA